MFDKDNIVDLLFILAVIFLIWLVVGCGNANAESYNSRAIKAVIGEAEDEGQYGMQLIACAIANRGSLKGVYGEKAPRVVKKLYSEKVEMQAEEAWFKANNPDDAYMVDVCEPLRGADHWGSKQLDRKWIKKMAKAGYVKTFEYKNHVFFRKDA